MLRPCRRLSDNAANDAMQETQVRPQHDWNDAYANAAHIDDAASYPPRWRALAQAWRDMMLGLGRAELGTAYGEGERQQYDLFYPASTPRGLAVFVHGGYWRAFDRSTWSHLASGAVARGWCVLMPGYTLAPQARIASISREVAMAIDHAAARVAGPLALSGHSAGGHLVTRMVCSDSPLSESVRARVKQVLSISGVHDLRPLRWTDMNQDLQLDEAEACAESPLLRMPQTQARITAWVGAQERPAFIRQTEALVAVWGGLGMSVQSRHAAGRHHFDVIDALCDADSAMCHDWLDLGA